MKRLSECINEGFFGNKYDSYKKRVLDTLASIGIVIDPSKMKRAEDWIRDFYADKMNVYDCARALRDDMRVKRVQCTEAYAADIIDGAPAGTRLDVVKGLRSLDSKQKKELDASIEKFSEWHAMREADVAKQYGHKILDGIKRGMAYDDAADYAANEKMSLQHAMSLLAEAGVQTQEEVPFKLQDLVAPLQKELGAQYQVQRTEKGISVLDKSGIPVIRIEGTQSDQAVICDLALKGVCNTYYPKLQGGADGIANRIRHAIQ